MATQKKESVEDVAVRDEVATESYQEKEPEIYYPDMSTVEVSPE